MSQKLTVSNFEWINDTSQFNEDFIKQYNEESDEGYFLEVDVQYLEKLLNFHNDLWFLPERMKIENWTCYTQGSNHRLVLKKVQRVIKFNQSAWRKPYIDANTVLRKKGKMILRNIFLSWRIMQFLEKLWKMVEDIEILTL